MNGGDCAALCALILCWGLLRSAWASGAGRAFPIEAENYAIRQFKNINPSLEWDRSNFLIDLAGNYANCNSVGTRGVIQVDRTTQEGHSIIGIVDSTSGTRADVDAVNGYIATIIDNWVRSGRYNNEIRTANKFGCSVRPGCSGQAVVSCLFSNSGPSNVVDPGDQPGRQNAYALTPQQYVLAERITGNRWDRSHFLENLSGYETDCAMIGASDWPFANAIKVARDAGIPVVGTFGYAPNTGSTQDALVTVLQGFKEIRSAKKIGCSLIADCMYSSGRGGREQMYVVVSCLYEES